MHNIVIFSRYAIRAPGFGTSTHRMIKLSLEEHGIFPTFLSEYEDLRHVRDSTILWLVKPNIYLAHRDKSDVGNKNILWNFEPFSFSHIGDEKLDKFRYLFNKMTANPSKYGLHHVLFFDKRQADFFGNRNCSYLPIGFHPCLASTNTDYTTKVKDKIIFVGNTERKRKIDLNMFSTQIAKPRGIKLVLATHKNFVSLEHNNDFLFSFRYGLSHHFRIHRLHTQWHRIMMYAANRVALISQDDLSMFGFDDRHYIYYNNLVELNRIDFKDYQRFETMSSNMLDKIKLEYSMPELFKPFLKIL